MIFSSRPHKRLFALPGAPLVKALPVNPTDPSVTGPDLFAKLVPMAAHEASSLYRCGPSEELTLQESLCLCLCVRKVSPCLCFSFQWGESKAAERHHSQDWRQEWNPRVSYYWNLLFLVKVLLQLYLLSTVKSFPVVFAASSLNQQASVIF